MLNRYARNTEVGGTAIDNANTQASEDNWRNPSREPLTDNDYRAMMAASYGQNASILALLQNLVELAKDRSQYRLLTVLGTDHAIPEGDMRSVMIGRPSPSEQTTAGAFATTLYITFDHTVSYQIPNPGITVLPIISGTRTYQVTAAGGAAPPAGWALMLLFRNTQYNPGANL